jgi:hypothetical protein
MQPEWKTRLGLQQGVLQQGVPQRVLLKSQLRKTTDAGWLRRGLWQRRLWQRHRQGQRNQQMKGIGGGTGSVWRHDGRGRRRERGRRGQ